MLELNFKLLVLLQVIYRQEFKASDEIKPITSSKSTPSKPNARILLSQQESQLDSQPSQASQVSQASFTESANQIGRPSTNAVNRDAQGTAPTSNVSSGNINNDGSEEDKTRKRRVGGFYAIYIAYLKSHPYYVKIGMTSGPTETDGTPNMDAIRKNFARLVCFRIN